MRYRYSSNCARFVYMYELKSGAVCLTACIVNAELVNGHGNKLGFQTFTRLATYSKAEQSHSDLNSTLPLKYRLKCIFDLAVAAKRIIY